MGILSRLFGQSGKVRFEGTTVNGQDFSGKMDIEVFGMNKEQIEEKLKEVFYVETGQEVKTLNVVSFYEN